MHFHGINHLDIRLSKDRVLAGGKAREHKYAPQAGWVTFVIRTNGDVLRAKALIELAYANARKIMIDCAFSSSL